MKNRGEIDKQNQEIAINKPFLFYPIYKERLKNIFVKNRGEMDTQIQEIGSMKNVGENMGAGADILIGGIGTRKKSRGKGKIKGKIFDKFKNVGKKIFDKLKNKNR